MQRDFEIRLRDFDKLPELLDVVVASGAEQISGTRYVLEDVQVAKELALKKAALNAKAKALRICTAMDAELGEILLVHEGHLSQPIMPMMERTAAPMLMSTAKSSANRSFDKDELVPSGEIKVSSSITALFAIK